MHIVFLGAPGSGKGTQASLAAEELKLVYLATGDLFRQEIEKGTELGLKVKPYVESGQLAPDEMALEIVSKRLSLEDARQGVVLDGFPRNLKQAQALDEVLGQKSEAIDKVIFIKVAEEELLKRLAGRWTCPQCQAQYNAISSPPKVWGRCDKCGAELIKRPDDAPETVAERLRVYSSETAPLIQHYQEQGKLVEVDGEGSVSEVKERINQALKEGLKL